MTLPEILSQVDAANLEVTIYRYGGKWQVQLKFDDNNDKLEVHRRAVTFSEALTEAWLAFSSRAVNGIPAALAPMIEHRPATADEIPF